MHTIAGSCLHDKGRVESPMVASHGWFRSFMEWQPQLPYQKGDPTASVKTECLTKEMISDYFALLKQELTNGNFMNSQNRIYNVDETGISLKGHAPWVVAPYHGSTIWVVHWTTTQPIQNLLYTKKNPHWYIQCTLVSGTQQCTLV